MDIRREMERLLSGLPAKLEEERPELTWLKEQYDIFLKKEAAVSKRAADKCLYQKIYGNFPEKDSDILKLRYWRTGRHLPVNYDTCFAFGKALNLNDEELRFLIQGYYDCCDSIFTERPKDMQSIYWKRKAVMEQIIEKYLEKIPPGRIKRMNIAPNALRHYIRHLYYLDALCCVKKELSERRYDLERHISSINYDSELSRNLKLVGMIPRKTLIRHLFILGMPDLSVDFINETLVRLGYLPLNEEHTLRTGERLDRLLILLLRWYEQTEGEADAQKRGIWLQEGLRTLDEHFEQSGLPHYRFMYFKALEIL